MRIRMTETRRGADDGFTVREYVAGQEYDLGHSPRALELAAVFLRENWAVKVGAKLPAPPAAPVAEEAPAPTPPPPAPTPAPAKGKGRPGR